jgi:sugar diacid utilization regulator
LNENNRKQSLIALTERLAPIMRRYGAYCGISPPFFEMRNMAEAYVQSDLALHYGRLLKTRNCPFKDLVSTMTLEHDGFFKYDDYFLYHMMDLCQKDDEKVLSGVSCVHTLNQLYRYDREHETDLVRLLYTFLLCERKATLVAEMLHMHRNNVLYHIARIEEMLHITLDDPDMRFKLMIAYKYWELDSCSQ